MNVIIRYISAFLTIACLLPGLAIAKNPFENTVYVPLKLKSFAGTGPEKKRRHVLTVQPIWSTPLNSDWDVIWRGGIKAVSKPGRKPGEERVWGLGDTFLSAFFSPADSGTLTWGIGPTVLFPTASARRLGFEKYAVGPSAVVLKREQKGHYGAFIRDVWSVAGDDGRPDIHRFLIQPLLKYKLSDGWFLSSSPAITANWEAPSDQRWTIPLGGGVGRTIKIGQQRTTFNVQFYRMIERPDHSPEWMVQAVLSFSIPR